MSGRGKIFSFSTYVRY